MAIYNFNLKVKHITGKENQYAAILSHWKVYEKIMIRKSFPVMFMSHFEI